MASGEEEEDGHNYEEEEDIFPGGMDPTESLNVLSVRRAMEKRSFYQDRSGQSSVDKDEGDDSTDDEFGRRQESVKFDGEFLLCNILLNGAHYPACIKDGKLNLLFL